MATDEYAKLFKRAWGDPDFKALTEAQQALYQKLISQSDLSMAGVLTLAIQRWAGQTSGLTPEAVEKTLADLCEHHFIVVDRDTQEVLIRSYIRRDLGWRSPQTMKGIAGAVERVLSPMLRKAISCELRRIDTSGLSSRISERTGRSTRQVVDDLISGLLEDTPSEGVSQGVSQGVSDTPSDRAYSIENESLHATATATAPAIATAIATAPATASPPEGGDKSPAAEPVQETLTGEVIEPPADNAGILVAEWIEHCKVRPPGNIVGQTSKQLRMLLDDGLTADQIRPGLAAWQRKGAHPSALPSFVNQELNSSPDSSRTRTNGLSDDQWAAAMRRAITYDQQETR